MRRTAKSTDCTKETIQHILYGDEIPQESKKIYDWWEYAPPFTVRLHPACSIHYYWA